eukprot:6188081-Pleurochrysis_carterae.AAC.3
MYGQAGELSACAHTAACHASTPEFEQLYIRETGGNREGGSGQEGRKEDRKSVWVRVGVNDWGRRRRGAAAGEGESEFLCKRPGRKHRPRPDGGE